MIEMTVAEALEELTQANFHSEHTILSARIAALENACRAYLEAYDKATGTVYVEPIIRDAMEGNNSAA